MNERLKQEYENWVEKDPVYGKLTNHIVGKSIAKHFYNLALEDVRKKINDEREHPTYDMCISEEEGGYYMGLSVVEEYIDNLTK